MPLPVFQLKGVRVQIRAWPTAGLAEANALPGLVVFSAFRCVRSQVRFRFAYVRGQQRGLMTVMLCSSVNALLTNASMAAWSSGMILA